jgi:hypothetical protein
MDPFPKDPWQTMLDKMRKLRETWPSRGWSWDGRLNCIASSFSMEFESKARTSVHVALPVEYTSTTIGQASQRLRDLAERTGGLRTGQFLLVGEPAGSAVPFGLWWPWGDGETISLRIGLADLDAMREPFPRLRDVFGVST